MRRVHRQSGKIRSFLSRPGRSLLATMWIIYFVCCTILFNNITALEVGDNCVPNDEERDGECIIVTKCEVALQAIRTKSRHPYQRCGFDDYNEIVCCPRTTTTTKNATEIGWPENVGRLTCYLVCEWSTKDRQSMLGAAAVSAMAFIKSGPDADNRLSERKSETECKKIMETSTPPLDLHIIGGESATMGEFPHMVAIGYEGDEGYQFNCGGALVSTSFVLTAAHCIVNLERKEPKIIRAGTVDLGDGTFNEQTDYRVVQNITYPTYKRSTQYNDIALLRLERPVEISSNLNAACLYTKTSDPDGNLTITGWGKTSTTKSDKSNVLLKTTVWASPQAQCEPHYRGWRKLPRGVVAGQLCAGDPAGGHDACQGDSGGPLQITIGREIVYRLVGVTSLGRGCGSPLPGIYTRVASYLDWIESVVWPN